MALPAVLAGAQLVAGLGSAYFGSKAAKKAAQQQQQYDQERLSRIMSILEPPGRGSSTSILRSKFREQIRGEDPDLREARERSNQVARSQVSLAQQRSEDRLEDEISRRNLQGSRRAMAEMRLQERDQRRESEQFEIQQQLLAEQAAERSKQAGLQNLMALEQFEARDRASRAGIIAGAMPTQSTAAQAEAQSAAGYGALGGQLIGRGLSGLTDFYGADSGKTKPAKTPTKVSGAELSPISNAINTLEDSPFGSQFARYLK